MNWGGFGGGFAQGYQSGQAMARNASRQQASTIATQDAAPIEDRSTIAEGNTDNRPTYNVSMAQQAGKGDYGYDGSADMIAKLQQDIEAQNAAAQEQRLQREQSQQPSQPQGMQMPAMGGLPGMESMFGGGSSAAGAGSAGAGTAGTAAGEGAAAGGSAAGGGAAAGGSSLAGAASAAWPVALIAAGVAQHEWAKKKGIHDNSDAITGRAFLKDSSYYQPRLNDKVDGLGDDVRMAGLVSSPADLFKGSTWKEFAQTAAKGGLVGKTLKKIF